MATMYHYLSPVGVYTRTSASRPLPTSARAKGESMLIRCPGRMHMDTSIGDDSPEEDVDHHDNPFP